MLSNFFRLILSKYRVLWCTVYGTLFLVCYAYKIGHFLEGKKGANDGKKKKVLL